MKPAYFDYERPETINDALKLIKNAGDNGKILGEAVRADVTLALHAKKLGHKMYPGSKLSGKIKIIDIGIYQ